MKRPLVSAIITTYNRRHFLRDAVLSVLKQDYEPKEIVVVDDGSSDNSFDVIRDLPVQYVWKPNGGVSSARNQGLSITCGQLVGFLDVDDLWSKGKLTAQVEALDNTDYALVYTDEIWIRNGKHLNQKKKHAKYSGTIFSKCLPLCIISPSSALIRRSVFDTVGFFDESLPVCEDYDMWLRITSAYPVLFVNKQLITKRGGHEDQLSRKYEIMDRFRIQSLVNLLKHKKLQPEMEMAAINELTMKCKIVINGFLKRGNNDDARYYSSLIRSFRTNGVD